ncbi:MAG: DUF5666 domain-containing protein [Burkholderiaceae bacterium]
MNPHTFVLPPWRRVASALTALAASLALLHGCGGGVEGQGTGSVSYSDGPISGFGSIIVNGVHFDETKASITDDDGHSLSSADLKLGMTVRVDAGAIDQATNTALATAVQVGSDLVGPVSANDLAATTITVLGQTVRITASTVFDDSLPGGQAAITVGAQVQVFSILDPVSGVYAARRVELAGAPTAYKLRGVVANLDKTAHTLQIGAATLAYSADTAPADLANGQIVRVKLQTAPDGNGRWVVTSFANGASRPPEGGETEIESVIASYTSNADFTLSGVRVNASGATIEPAGSTLAAGVRVEVEGTYSGGVLMAKKVEVKGSGDDGGDDSGGGQTIELEGRISALDTEANTFVLRGETVDYATATFKSGATEDKLVALPKVHIKGHLGDDGTTVIAEELEIDD